MSTADDLKRDVALTVVQASTNSGLAFRLRRLAANIRFCTAIEREVLLREAAQRLENADK